MTMPFVFISPRVPSFCPPLPSRFGGQTAPVSRDRQHPASSPFKHLPPSLQTTEQNNNTLMPSGGESGSIKNCPMPDLRRHHLVGLASDLLRHTSRTMELTPKYGPIYKADYGGHYVTVVSDLDAIAEVLADSTVFRTSGALPRQFAQFLGENAIVHQDGLPLKKKRMCLRLTFFRQLFPSYFKPIKDSAHRLWDRVSKEVASSGAADVPMMVRDHFLSIIVQNTTGRSIAAGTLEMSEVNRLTRLFSECYAGIFSLPFSPARIRAFRSREYLLKLYMEIIRDRLLYKEAEIAELRAKAKEGDTAIKDCFKTGKFDALTALVASTSLPIGSNTQLGQNELVDTAELLLFLWFAGFVTQSRMILNGIMHIGFDEEIRRRLLQEQKTIMQRHTSRELDLQQITEEMPLLESFIYEVLRLYPSVPVWYRKASQDVEICGHQVKENELLGLDFVGGLRNPKYFDQPETFKVDRFINNHAEDKYKHFPFGTPRSDHFCMGVQLSLITMKTTLSVLLREFDFDLDASQSRVTHWFPEVQPSSRVQFARLQRWSH